MTKQIHIGIDLDYDQIIVTILDEKTYELATIEGLNKSLPTTISFDGKEFQVGEKPWKKHSDKTFFSNIISNPSDLKIETLDVFDYETELLDETKLALIIHHIKAIVSQKGTIQSVSCCIPNNCNLTAIERIRKAFEVNGFSETLFFPQGLAPFLFMFNFDAEVKKFLNYEKKHVIVDVSSGEINFNFGKLNRKENEKKVELTKWKTSTHNFDDIRQKLRNFVMKKCKENIGTVFTENDFSSAVKLGEFDEKVEQMIVQLFDDVESVRISFVTNTEPFVLEIATSEIVSEISDVVGKIVSEMKEFMQSLKIRGFVDFVGKFSRFVPLRNAIVEMIKSLKWKERYVLDCENIKSIGTSMIGKLREVFVSGKKDEKIDDDKIQLNWFDVEMKLPHEMASVNVYGEQLDLTVRLMDDTIVARHEKDDGMQIVIGKYPMRMRLANYEEMEQKWQRMSGVVNTLIKHRNEWEKTKKSLLNYKNVIVNAAKERSELEKIKTYVLEAIKNKEYNIETLTELKDMIAQFEGCPAVVVEK